MGGYGVAIVYGTTVGVTSFLCWGSAAWMLFWNKDEVGVGEDESNEESIKMIKMD